MMLSCAYLGATNRIEDLYGGAPFWPLPAFAGFYNFFAPTLGHVTPNASDEITNIELQTGCIYHISKQSRMRNHLDRLTEQGQRRKFFGILIYYKSVKLSIPGWATPAGGPKG